MSVRSVLTPLLAGVLVCSFAAPAQAVPMAGAQIVIAGIASGEFTYPLETGKRITIKRHVLDPGEIIRWDGPSTIVAMHGNEEGDLTNYPNCRSQQRWRGYLAYYVPRSKAAGTLTGATLNSSTVPIEFYTVQSEALGRPQNDEELHREPNTPQVGELTGNAEAGPGELGDPIVAANGCPKAPEGETSEIASGRMTSSTAIELIDHTQIVVYRHTVPAGYHSGWYSPYWATQIIPVSGEITIAHGCADTAPLPVGQAAVADGPILVRSAAGAEYLSVSWGVQNAFPIDVPFYLPEPPPAGCPETALPL